MKCRECINFQKQNGSKSKNTDKGICTLFSVERSKNTLADNTQKVENLYTIEEREQCGIWRTSKNFGIKNTKSVEVVKCAFKSGNINEGIVSDVHFWCDGDFFCAAFCPF